MKDKRKHGNWMIVPTCFLIIVLMVATFICRQYYQMQMKQLDRKAGKSNEYSKHYAFIVDDLQDSFYQAVYEGAKETGEARNVYVEFMGKDLSVDYNKEQLLDIAIDARVDGIILEGDESETLSQRITKAIDQGIPVVTIGRDSTFSVRKSYIGVSNYTLGRESGKQIAQMATDEKQKVMILMSSDSNTSQYIINSSIREVLEESKLNNDELFDIESVLIPDDTVFESEESIRDLFVKNKELPDILVCLNELYTNCATQAVIDYNKVGTVEIIGYFTNETILHAIEEDVVHSTIAINTNQMGAYCVEALNEYDESGYVNEYMSVDLTMVTSENVKEFMSNEESKSSQE